MRVKRPGTNGNRGETTRGRTGFGAKRPGTLRLKWNGTSWCKNSLLYLPVYFSYNGIPFCKFWDLRHIYSQKRMHLTICHRTLWFSTTKQIGGGLSIYCIVLGNLAFNKGLYLLYCKSPNITLIWLKKEGSCLGVRLRVGVKARVNVRVIVYGLRLVK